jgi:hypothetical protein
MMLMSEGLSYLAIYREFYPAILAYTNNDWKKLPEQLPPTQEAKTWVRNLQEDSQRIKDRVSLVQWPEQQLLRMVQEYTRRICKTMIDRGRKLSRGEIAQFEATGIDWKSILSTIPKERLASANDWKRPFDTINLQLDGSMFPMLEELLDEMRSWIMRGHGWFGVGEWNIANRCYLNALTWALAFNDLPAVEIIVRFLTDTYTTLSVGFSPNKRDIGPVTGRKVCRRCELDRIHVQKRPRKNPQIRYTLSMGCEISWHVIVP